MPRFADTSKYLASLLKITALTIFIIAGLALTLGAGPKSEKKTGEIWRDYSVFINGFKGLANSALYVIWAVGDQFFICIVAGKASSARYLLHGARGYPARSHPRQLDERVFGGSGVSASTFVIAMNDTDIRGLPGFLNLVITIGIAAITVESMTGRNGIDKGALQSFLSAAILCVHLAVVNTGEVMPPPLALFYTRAVPLYLRP
ncbi:hypothetical protein LZ554_007746 [Drepanopeziza brunnea f. sp. 'monogermtubi']|nr:hypothetical protein LZ554_007746 [Drepanopeziza brunnea f. sp. 'monogermtubi']